MTNSRYTPKALKHPYSISITKSQVSLANKVFGPELGPVTGPKERILSILSQKIAKNKSPEKVNRHRTHIFHGQADIDDPSTYRRLNSWGSTLRSRYISLAVRFGRTKHTNCDARDYSRQLNRHEGTNEAGLRGSLRVSGGRCVDLVVGRGSVKVEQERRAQDTENIGKRNIGKRGKI